MVTCISKHSSNRLVGYLIGTGMTDNDSINQISMVVEVIYTCEVIK